MRAVIQRVTSAGVTIEGRESRTIGRGLAVLIGIGRDDTPEDVRRTADKIAALRIFPNEAGRFDRSAVDTGGEVLIVSQFTLYADCSRGKRPDFTDAARPEKALPLYTAFIEAVKDSGLRVQTGEFAADMAVQIENDGPVTIVLDSSDF